MRTQKSFIERIEMRLAFIKKELQKCEGYYFRHYGDIPKDVPSDIAYWRGCKDTMEYIFKIYDDVNQNFLLK